MPTIFVYGAVMTHTHSLAHGEAAYIEDHAVRFVVSGVPILEPAFAALEHSPGERAWGVVADWPDRVWAPVRMRETPYVERPVRTVTKSGAVREAIALFLKRARASSEQSPSARYASLLLQGAQKFEFPEDVIARYRRAVEQGPQLTYGIAKLFGRRRRAKGWFG
ncbi:MAG: hypothetical protein ACXWUG_23515 [Polyangiales bacterium]